MLQINEHQHVIRWLACLGLALLFHAAILYVFLWLNFLPASQIQLTQSEAILIELAPVPTAPPTQPSAQPPGPEQQEQMESQLEYLPELQPEIKQLLTENNIRLAEPLPDIAKAEVTLPPEAAVVKEFEEQQPPMENSSAEVTQTTAPPDVDLLPDIEYAASQSLVGDSNQISLNWQAQILGKLEQVKRYPREARFYHQEGTVQISYEVDRKGKVLRVELVRSSGFELLDKEAITAIQRASPLPPPPVEIAGDPVKVATAINFFLRK